MFEKVPIKNEHDYTDAPNIVYLSEYKHAAIQYIAGYVAKSVTKQILCIKCRKEGVQKDMAATIDVKQVFTNLEDHMLDCIVTENCIFLIKIVAKTYCKIRFYHLGKEKTQISSTGFATNFQS